MMEMLREPGFYVLLIPLVATAAQLVATLLLRPRWRAFADKVDDFRSKPDLTEADRAWLALLVSEATDRRAVWLLAIIAPLVAPAVLILSVIEALKYRRQSVEQSLTRIDNETAALKAAGVSDLGYDVREAKYWSSPIRTELEDEADFLQWLSAPIPALIASVFMYPALLPSVLITYCSQAIRKSELDSFGHLLSARLSRSLHRIPS